MHLYRKSYTTMPEEGALIGDKYKLLKYKGEGANATVWSAEDTVTGKRVAIKHIKFDEGIEVLKRTCREIRLLKYFVDHDNIVRLFDVIQPQGEDINEVFLILELMEADLSTLLKTKLQFLQDNIKIITHKILFGLYSLHKLNIVHRDIKPPNILLSLKDPLQVKLCDFGTGRFIRPSKKMSVSSLLDVSTLYYCAPEGILNQHAYSTSVDMWALGCILVEIITKKPLLVLHSFDYRSIERGLLKKMVEMCGKPSAEELSGVPETELKTFTLACDCSEPALDKMLKDADSKVVTFIKNLLRFDPEKRLNARSALLHPFLDTAILPSELCVLTESCPYKQLADPVDTKSENQWTELLMQEIRNFIVDRSVHIY